MEGTSSSTTAAPENGQQTQGTPGKIVSRSEPVKADMTLKNFIDTPTSDIENTGGEGAAAGAEGAGAAGNEGEDSGKDVDIESVKKFLKKEGIAFEGDVDELKKKLTPAKAEATAEEKAAADAAFDKRMLDHFIANGGKVEDFVRLKNIASSDLREISVSTIKQEMKNEGFDDGQIDAVIKERYYQLNPDEIEQGIEETDEEFAARKALIEKKKTFGSKKLDNRGLSIKEKAEGFLKTLKEAIEVEDLLAAKETEFSSKVDETIGKLPRTVKVELGKINNQEVAPISVPVSEEVFTEIASVLKNPETRNQFFYNPDNSLNLNNVVELMMRNKILETALEAAYTEGSSRQVEEIRKVFPGVSPHDIGVGGQTTKQGRKGNLVAAGKPEPMPVKR